MDLTSIIITLLIVIFSAILHEIMHGIVAERLGDPTARLLGRITLNPLPHIDLYMTIILPVILIITQIPLIKSGHPPIIFGGAKPVPVDPFNLRDGRKDMALVSIAGPITNLVLAIGFAGLIHLLGFGNSLYPVLRLIVEINLLLGIFNLIPIPPLDGSKIWTLFLSESQALSIMNLGTSGFILIFAFLYFFGGILGSLVEFSLHLLGL